MGWPDFPGTPAESRELRGEVLGPDGRPKAKYVGVGGFDRFVMDHDEKKEFADMGGWRRKISAVLDEEEFKLLGWPHFPGTLAELRALSGEVLGPDGRPKTKYVGTGGLARFARGHDEKREFAYVGTWYSKVSAALGGFRVLRKLGFKWKDFKGTVLEYETLVRLFKEYPLEAFQGAGGQDFVAQRVFKGDKGRAYLNVSILREELLGDRRRFPLLGWERR